MIVTEKKQYIAPQIMFEEIDTHALLVGSDEPTNNVEIDDNSTPGAPIVAESKRGWCGLYLENDWE